MAKILIVEDDFDINNLLRDILGATHEVFQAYDGELAKQLIVSTQFDLLILDLMLPNLSGEQLIELTRKNQSTPILVITAKSEVDTLVEVFDLGANDYIAKPFRKKEVLARVQHLLKLGDMILDKSKTLTLGNLVMDVDQYQVFVEDQELVLTVKEFELLKAFLLNPKKVFTKADLYQQVWEKEYDGDDNTLNVHISRLRTKLLNSMGEDPIETIWGIGFKLKV